MFHKLGYNQNVFTLSNGTKMIEIRLNGEKRQHIWKSKRNMRF